MMLLWLMIWMSGAAGEDPLITLLRQDPAARALALAFHSGQRTPLDLRVWALKRADSQPRPTTRNRDEAPTLEDVYIPADADLPFYGGSDLCDGPHGPLPHAFTVPAYISILYRRITYDPGAESWGGEGLGIQGRGVGVIYSGFVQRIWGHGFAIELETDPLNGINQRVELVQFEESECPILPGITIPCIKPKGLFTFQWSVKDKAYQIRRAKRSWQDVFQLFSFYSWHGYVMVAGTPCDEMRGLEGVDAGFAEGDTTVWQPSPLFPWSPCGDFVFSQFHLRTQKRFNPWPGKGMPLLVFTRAAANERQREQTSDDLERARSRPTTMDEAAGFDPRYLGADRNENMLQTESFSRRATEEARRRMSELETALRHLGETFPQSHLGAFTRFASRHLEHQRVYYLNDPEDPEQVQALRERFPRWAVDRLVDDPDMGFTHQVAVWLDMDWRPPWSQQRYRQVFEHPPRVIAELENLDDTAREQGALVEEITTTTPLINHDTDNNTRSDWPDWTWPAIENPDTYWSIYLTWH